MVLDAESQIAGAQRGEPDTAREAAAVNLWPAWRSLADWEQTAEAELGDPLPELLLLLWSLHRFGGGTEGLQAFFAVVGDELCPGLSDEVLEDMVAVAFALGAAWADERAKDA